MNCTFDMGISRFDMVNCMFDMVKCRFDMVIFMFDVVNCMCDTNFCIDFLRFTCLFIVLLIMVIQHELMFDFPDSTVPRVWWAIEARDCIFWGQRAQASS